MKLQIESVLQLQESTGQGQEFFCVKSMGTDLSLCVSADFIAKLARRRQRSQEILNTEESLGMLH